MLAYTPFLAHRILGATFVSVTPVAKQIQHAIGGWRQRGHEILRQPTHEEMHVPIGGFKQAPKAPRRDGSWRPPGQLFQGFAPGRDRLHKEEPAEYETMATAPYRGHAAKDHGDKTRQIGEGDQHVQSPRQRRERENSCQ